MKQATHFATSQDMNITISQTELGGYLVTSCRGFDMEGRATQLLAAFSNDIDCANWVGQHLRGMQHRRFGAKKETT